MMANNHRARIAVRSDFNHYWSLKQFRNPKVRYIIVRCESCNPRPKPYNRSIQKRTAKQIIKSEI